MPTILCVDDDPSVGMLLDETLRRAGHRTRIVRHVPDALHALDGGGIDLIVADYRMPGISGREFLALLQRGGHEVPVLMLAAYSAVEHHVAAMRAGAIGCVTKPVRPQQLSVAVNQALEVARLRRDTVLLRREVQALRHDRELVGDSAAMRRLRQMASVAAATRATVLLEGEAETGKETLARAIHAQSERADGPFVLLDCTALPDELIARALFGEDAEARVATPDRIPGAFERARRGTLLLQEVGALSPELQTQLLHALQEVRLERAPGQANDVRLIATSSAPLAPQAANGRFRPDLHYRLSTIAISVPPLRERRDDVSPLALHFAAAAAERLGKRIDGIEPEAVARLQRASWPGNLRELREVIEHAVANATGFTITTADLPRPRGVEREVEREPDQELAPASNHAPMESRQALRAPPAPAEEVVLKSLNVDDAERLLIQRALETTGQNRTKAAELLGMSVRTLRNKLNARPGQNREPGEARGLAN